MLWKTACNVPGEIGRLFMPTPASVIWDAPAPLDHEAPRPLSAKFPQFCPAVIDLDA